MPAELVEIDQSKKAIECSKERMSGHKFKFVET